MTIQVSDSFTDTTGTDLSAHTVSPTNVPGGSWTELTNTWQIAGGVNAGLITSGAQNSSASIPCGFADGNLSVEADSAATNTATSGDCGLIVRASDSNNFFKFGVNAQADAFRIVERNGGTNTTRATTSITITPGTYYTVTVNLNGQTVTAQLDGANEISYGSAALNETVENHGLQCRYLGDRMDDFLADDGISAVTVWPLPGLVVNQAVNRAGTY